MEVILEFITIYLLLNSIYLHIIYVIKPSKNIKNIFFYIF